MDDRALQRTSWLAKRLGLSVTTILRLRGTGSADLPPAIQIGTSFRYDPAHVEQWLLDRAQASAIPAASN
jgi:predicted DNA-binding transcriptional regulator AlpA